jgi:drug/metabolite transporter (DMT)-like permease
MPTHIIGLGLIVAGVLFIIFLGFVGLVIGIICILGGIAALAMTYMRRRNAA